VIPTVVGVALAVLAFVAVEDLLSARIRNVAVLVLIGCWLVLAALEGFTAVGSSLAAGGLLLALGIGAWVAGVMGAGDAKLLSAGGLLLGLPHLMPFSLVLVAATLLSVVLLAGARMVPFMVPPVFAARLDAIVSTRRIPAAVPICIALAVVLVDRYPVF
jgi:prepilin peptidase CpaA